MNKKDFDNFTKLENEFKAIEKLYKAEKEKVISEVKKVGTYKAETVITDNGEKVVETWTVSLANNKTVVTVTNNPQYRLIQAMIPEEVKAQCMGFQNNTTLKHN